MGNFKSAHNHREAWPLQDQIRRPSSGMARLTPPLTLALLASLSSKNTSYLPCAHILLSKANKKFTLGQGDTPSLLS